MNVAETDQRPKHEGTSEGPGSTDAASITSSGDPGRTPGKAEGTETGNVRGSGSPGRTPGSAEGEDDPEETGQA